MATDQKESVTRLVLSEQIAGAINVPARDATKLVDSVISTITDTLTKGDEVMISGFGKFVLLDKKERTGRNPRTGEKVKIKARRILKFRASEVLKSLVNKDLV